MDRMELMAAQYASGWIKCSERKPELNVEVLIYHVLGDTDRPEVPHAVDTAWLFADGWHFPWDRADKQRPMFVTHWMQLPSAPVDRTSQDAATDKTSNG